MRTLTRYCLCEFTKVFLVSLTGLTAVVILAFLAKEAVEEGLGPVAILRLIPYVVPQALQFAVPGTVLLAATSTYGRMSAGNEVVAVKSAGISPLAIIWPTLVLVTLLSMGTVWLNDIAFSWGRSGVERVLLESLEEIAYGQLRNNRSFDAAGVSIVVERVEGQRLIGPVFTIHRPDADSLTFTAKTAELRSDPQRRAIIMRLDHVSSDDNEQANIDWPDDYEWEFDLEDFSSRPISADNPSQMPLAEVPRAIATQTEIIETTRQELAALAAFSLAAGDPQALVGEQWNSGASRLARARSTLARLKTEPHRRWASGFSCLAFVLVGIPMAIRRRHAEFLASFFACFLPILLLYYPLLVVGLDRAKDGALPPVAVWTGNVVFAMWGIWLLRRVIRY